MVVIDLSQCAYIVPIIFWQLANLGIFGYACAFLFWYDDMKKIFKIPIETSLVQLYGVVLLQASSGINQMQMYTIGGSNLVKKVSFMLTLLLYMLSAIAGLVVVSATDIFISSQRIAFVVLQIVFLVGLILGLFGSCAGFCTFTNLNTNSQLPAASTSQFEEPVYSSRRTRIPKSRADFRK